MTHTLRTIQPMSMPPHVLSTIGASLSTTNDRMLMHSFGGAWRATINNRHAWAQYRALRVAVDSEGVTISISCDYEVERNGDIELGDVHFEEHFEHLDADKLDDVIESLDYLLPRVLHNVRALVVDGDSLLLAHLIERYRMPKLRHLDVKSLRGHSAYWGYSPSTLSGAPSLQTLLPSGDISCTVDEEEDGMEEIGDYTYSYATGESFMRAFNNASSLRTSCAPIGRGFVYFAHDMSVTIEEEEEDTRWYDVLHADMSALPFATDLRVEADSPSDLVFEFPAELATRTNVSTCHLLAWRTDVTRLLKGQSFTEKFLRHLHAFSLRVSQNMGDPSLLPALRSLLRAGGNLRSLSITTADESCVNATSDWADRLTPLVADWTTRSERGLVICIDTDDESTTMAPKEMLYMVIARLCRSVNNSLPSPVLRAILPSVFHAATSSAPLLAHSPSPHCLYIFVQSLGCIEVEVVCP